MSELFWFICEYNYLIIIVLFICILNLLLLGIG